MNETRLPVPCVFCGKMPTFQGSMWGKPLHRLHCGYHHCGRLTTSWCETPYLAKVEWNALCLEKAWDAALQRGDANFPFPENDGAHFVDSNDEN